MKSFLFAFLLLIPCVALAAEENAPIEITADEALEWDREAFTFVARGNAKIVQGQTSLTATTLTANYTETDKGMTVNSVTATGNRPKVVTAKETLTSDKAVATFSPDKSGELDNITATGNVVIETKTETLTGDKAEYQPTEQKAVVTGHVKITRDNNVLTGERAVFDMKTNTSTMTGEGKGRVKAVFFPQSK